jgi:peptidoglycan-associated lipoprotein
MWVSVTRTFAATAKPAAIVACVLFAAGCAENKPAPEAQMTGGVENGSPQDFLLNVGDRVFFTENSTDLSQTSVASLDKQSAWLVKYPSYRVTIEGHSDEKGDKKKNKRLSEQRAAAVEKYLATRGVDKSRLHVVSYGRDKRVATCNDVSCWSQNRRVVTVLQTSASPAPHARTQVQARATTRTQSAPQSQSAAPQSQQMPVFASPPPQNDLVRTDTFDASSQITQ